MIFRRFKLVFGLFMALWLGALVPAHRVLDALAEHHATAHEAEPADSNPQHHDDSHCTICLYTTGLTVAWPPAIEIASPELLTITAQRAPPAPVIATLPTPIRGRAPPVCSA